MNFFLCYSVKALDISCNTISTWVKTVLIVLYKCAKIDCGFTIVKKLRWTDSCFFGHHNQQERLKGESFSPYFAQKLLWWIEWKRSPSVCLFISNEALFVSLLLILNFFLLFILLRVVSISLPFLRSEKAHPAGNHKGELLFLILPHYFSSFFHWLNSYHLNETFSKDNEATNFKSLPCP